MRRWDDCIFDLYGTLVDIRTDENSPKLWDTMALWYKEYGASYEPEELHRCYLKVIRELEKEAVSAYPDGRPHEAKSSDVPKHPTASHMEKASMSDNPFKGAIFTEIKIEQVFLRLFQDRKVQADRGMAEAAGKYFRKNSLNFIRLYRGTRSLLEALKADSRRIWLLSNAQHLFTMPELKSLDLIKYFDGIYLSSDYGVKKPDPLFFRALLDSQGISPGQCIMIGNDGTCDIYPARSLGLSTIYVHSDISPDEPLPDADYLIEKMDLALVQKILIQ